MEICDVMIPIHMYMCEQVLVAKIKCLNYSTSVYGYNFVLTKGSRLCEI